MGVPIGYDDWQALLAEEFFQQLPGNPPVVMFLDDEGVGGLCPACPDAMGSLRSAVIAELQRTDGHTVFTRIHRRVAAWSKGGRNEPPPVLPLLALTVVAASRMRNDATFSAKAYYPRLAELLSPSLGSEDVLARGVKKHFDEVAEMWQRLHCWIMDNQHRLGPSTIGTHPRFHKVGYPLSQAVLRTSDRELLGEFFERIHLDKRSMPPAEELLRLLRFWLDRPRGVSTTFQALLDQGSADTLLMDLVHKLAEAYQGPAHSSGRVRLQLRLRIDLEAWQISWAIPVHEALNADELSFHDGSTVSIAKPDYGSAYKVQPASFEDDADLLERKFRANGRGSVLVKDKQDVWILSVDPTSGKWQSVDAMEPGHEHLLMVRETRRATFTDLLSQKAAPGYRKLRNQMVPGWDLYADVVLAGNTGAGSTREDGLAQVLEADIAPVPRLVNGLPLRTDVGGRHYLRGGEPDLAVPTGGTTKNVSVVLDGVSQVLKANGVPLPLRYFGPMDEGKHSVEVDGITLDFFVHASGDAALGQVLQPPDPDVGDPILRDSGPTYAHCRRRKDASIWFVFPSGRVRQHPEPLVPRFLEQAGIRPSLVWKVSIPQDAVWAVAERNGQFSQPQYVRNQVGDFGPLDWVSKQFWRRVTPDTITCPDRRWLECLSNVMQESVHGR